MNIQFKIKYNGGIYPVDMFDFVNQRVAFRHLDENMKMNGAHVDWNKYEILMEPKMQEALTPLPDKE